MNHYNDSRLKRSIVWRGVLVATLIATPVLAQETPAQREVRTHCVGRTFCARYDLGLMSFVGGDHAAGILLLPIGADASAGLLQSDAVRIELGVSVFGPGLNILGFVRDSSQAKTDGQCVRGNTLCAPVLGAAMFDVRARFDNSGSGFAVLAAVGYLATALPTEVHGAGGAFFGLEFTPGASP